MQRTSQTIKTQLAVVWRHTLSSATQSALAILCGLLLVSGTLAQEPRPEPSPEPSTPEASTTEKPPDPNETVTPSPLASQVVDGDLIFTSPGQFTYTRDIRLSDNFGGLRFYGANSLTTQPAGAAIQFFGNNAGPFNGQLYLDSGANNAAALIFRTAPTGGTITERMRIAANGNVGIGTTSPAARLDVTTSSGAAVTGSSSSAIGVIGFGLTGVFGQGTTGVHGFSSSGDGVVGRSSSGSFSGVAGFGSSTGAGIYGENTNSGGYAGFFVGRVHVNGNLSKGSGSFKIDHPLDPENKYLSHSFVESPDMMNIYNGNVTLDRRGRATVIMPPYFAALNREFRYQLTAVGAPGPNLYVAAEIAGNQFKIAGGRPGTKVSWLVTGVRQDAYANTHRITVEEDKPATERGTYLHPEAFGQPKEKGVARAQQREPSQQLTAASAQRKEN